MKTNDLAAHMLMGAILGGPGFGKQLNEIIDAPEPRVPVEQDPRFHRIEKILPSEFFISTGPGELEDKHYACIMAPKKNEADGYDVVAKCRYGFDGPREAMDDAARQYPSLPILSGPDEYQYPFYDMRKMQILAEAQERRNKRKEKLRVNWKKTQEGQKIK